MAVLLTKHKRLKDYLSLKEIKGCEQLTRQTLKSAHQTSLIQTRLLIYFFQVAVVMTEGPHVSKITTLTLAKANTAITNIQMSFF